MGITVSNSVDTFMRTTTKSGMRDAIESGWFVTPEMYGAVGDGVANDRDALFDSITAAQATGKRFLGKPGATYRCESSVSIDRPGGCAPLVLDFQGATVVLINSKLFLGNNIGSMTILTTELAEDTFRDDPLIELASVTGVQKGDLVEINTKFTDGGIDIVHYYIVNELDGNEVYIEGSVVCDITQAQRDAGSKIGLPPVKVFRLPGSLTIENLQIITETPTASQTQCLEIIGGDVIRVNNCHISGNVRNQLNCRYYGSVIVDGCVFRDFGYTERNSGYDNLATSPSGSSFGYGLIVARGYSCMMRNCVGMRGWHAFDASEGAMLNTVADCHFLRNAFAVSCHISAWRLNTYNCIFEGNHGVTTGRCQFAEISGCQFRGITNQAITFSASTELYIRNNLFDCRANKGNTSGSFIFTGTSTPLIPQTSVNHGRIFECTDNSFHGPRRTSVGFPSPTADDLLVVQGNRFTAGATLHAVRCAGTTFVKDNTFGVVPQYCMDVYLGEIGPSVFIVNNIRTELPTSFTNSGMIRLRGAQTTAADVQVIGNRCMSQSIVYFNNADTTVALMSNNINKSGGTRRLATGVASNTITLAINNLYDTEITNASGPVITDSINNVDAP